eukprot:scaffold855_cov140-Skeletonema_menzelii.AAC.13
MVFTCKGPTFTAMSLDYSTDGQLIGTITAADDWDKYTKGKFHLNVGGEKYDVTFTLCLTLTSSSVACGSPGKVIFDMSGFAATYLGQDFTSSKTTTLITASSIDFSAKPNGKTEHCKKHVLTSGMNSNTNGTKGSLIALAVVVGVGLAAYAMKRAKMKFMPAIEVKRIRMGRSRSNMSLSSRSRSIPKNDAEEKLVNEGVVIV